MRRALVLLWLAACGTDRVVAPVIDTPANDADATATGLDDITLTVAHAGADRDLVSQNFSHGADIELGGVPFGDDLVIHMSGFVGQSTVAYGRTCSFAVSSSVAAPSPHLFFTRTVKFADTQVLDAHDNPTLPAIRVDGVGVAFLGGALLLNGGTPGASGLTPVTIPERYDPATNRLTTLGQMVDRSRGAYALLGNGSKVVVLGGVASGQGAQVMEVIDSQTVDQLAFPGVPRADLTATQLVDGQVLVVGGQTPDAKSSDELDLIDPSDSSVVVHKLDTQLMTPRWQHTATRLSDDLGSPVLIAGGTNEGGMAIAAAELFEPLDSKLSISFSGMMKTPRYRHKALRLPDGSIVFIGGLNASGTPLFGLEQFTRDAGFSTVQNALPMDAGVVDFAAVNLPDGRILITGGRTEVGGAPVNTAYILRLDPVDGMIDVIATDHMSVARAGHQMAVLCDGTVLISGGNTTSTIERYNPPPAGRR